MTQLDQYLHLKHTQLAQHEPWLIPTLGFGEQQVLGVYRGQYVTMVQVRAYLMHCQHVITAIEHLGQSCSLCLAELQATGHPYAEWASRVCVRCVRRCSKPLCRHGVICPDHAGQADDGRFYCPQHYYEYEAATKHQRLEDSHGSIVAHGVGLIKSLLFDDKKSLK